MPSESASPQYEVRVERNIRIPVADGKCLAADLFFPDAPGRFPAVFDYYPYRKDDTSAANLRYHRYLAQHGFVGIRLDVRGTGGSGGTAIDEYTPREQFDVVEAIEWMARQPWCNGNVGMFGTSYGGFNSLQVAMHRPPALKAICPMYFTDNRYTDDCHYKGGALQMLFDTGTYGLFMVVLNALPPHPQATGADWATLWEEHLEAEPWLLRWLEHQTYDEQWKQGSLAEDYGAISCAVYLFGGWRDGYTNCNLRVFQHLRCPKKVLIGPWLHVAPDVGVPGPRIDHLHEMARFFDYWLRGVDDGVMAEPPITVYVQQFDPPAADRAATSGFWRHEADWPLGRSVEHPLYLGGGGALANEPPTEASAVIYHYNSTVGTTFGMFSASSPLVLPVDQRLEEAYSKSWTSAPLTEPLEILGYARVVLNVSATTDVATVVARLIDVAPHGTAALVTKGVLNLTHRDSHEAPTPIVPGKRYEVTVPLDATSWRFEPGHQIRFGLSGADFPNTWPSPRPYLGTIYLGRETPSRLILPIVGPQEPALPPPKLRPPAPSEPTAEVQAERPIWRVSRDYMAGATEVFLRTAHRARVGEDVEFTRGSEMNAVASERDPARASVRGLSWVTLQLLDRTVDTRARGQIESTANTFHVTIQLDITMNGIPYLAKRWARSIPRHLL
jgi:putative CocE/NonD family hydrolase